MSRLCVSAEARKYCTVYVGDIAPEKEKRGKVWRDAFLRVCPENPLFSPPPPPQPPITCEFVSRSRGGEIGRAVAWSVGRPVRGPLTPIWRIRTFPFLHGRSSAEGKIGGWGWGGFTARSPSETTPCTQFPVKPHTNHSRFPPPTFPPPIPVIYPYYHGKGKACFPSGFFLRESRDERMEAGFLLLRRLNSIVSPSLPPPLLTALSDVGDGK